MKTIIYQIVNINTGSVYAEYNTYKDAERDAMSVNYWSDVFIRKVYKD